KTKMTPMSIPLVVKAWKTSNPIVIRIRPSNDQIIRSFGPIFFDQNERPVDFWTAMGGFSSGMSGSLTDGKRTSSRRYARTSKILRREKTARIIRRRNNAVDAEGGSRTHTGCPNGF